MFWLEKNNMALSRIYLPQYGIRGGGGGVQGVEYAIEYMYVKINFIQMFLLTEQVMSVLFIVIFPLIKVFDLLHDYEVDH